MNATERMTNEQLTQLESIYDNLNKQLILLEAFMDAHRPGIEDDKQKFLADMNATKDPGADYKVAYIASPVPELPNLDNVVAFTETSGTTAETASKADLKGDLVQKFGLEANTDENKKLVDAALWERLVKTFVIAGWNMKQLLESKWWKEQSIEISVKEVKRLNELSLLRDQMILKEMDLALVQEQNGMTEIEKLAFTELATKENLK